MSGHSEPGFFCILVGNGVSCFNFKSTSNGGDKNFCCAGATQYSSTLGGRGPGGEDIINQQDFAVLYLSGLGDPESASHIFTALMTGEADLRLRLSLPLQNALPHGQLLADRFEFEGGPSDQLGLIEASLAELADVQRYRHD